MTGHSSSRTDANRSAILAHLGAQGATSRADLARALTVSPALITQLTKDLLRDGLIVELEQQASQGGRPARLIGIAASAGRAIGVKIVADHLAFVEVGIDGAVVRSAIEPFEASRSTVLGDLTAQLRRFIDGGAAGRLLGVGVGVPGEVDEQGSGRVDSTMLGWQQVPLGETLRRELGLPVLVENNVNALAMAERLYGVGRRYSNFLVVTIGTGVGAGVVLDGGVLRGSAGGAGNLGQLPVVFLGQEGPASGPLESFIGESALVARARIRSIIRESGGYTALREAADAQDAAAVALFEEAGHLFGTALAGAVHLLDPEAVVVLGEGTAAWSHWSFGFETAFRSALTSDRRGVPVIVESWQDESWAQGAAALVLATPFDAEGVSGDQGRLVRARLVEQSAPQDGRG